MSRAHKRHFGAILFCYVGDRIVIRRYDHTPQHGTGFGTLDGMCDEGLARKRSEILPGYTFRTSSRTDGPDNVGFSVVHASMPRTVPVDAERLAASATFKTELPTAKSTLGVSSPFR